MAFSVANFRLLCICVEQFHFVSIVVCYLNSMARGSMRPNIQDDKPFSDNWNNYYAQMPYVCIPFVSFWCSICLLFVHLMFPESLLSFLYHWYECLQNWNKCEPSSLYVMLWFISWPLARNISIIVGCRLRPFAGIESKVRSKPVSSTSSVVIRQFWSHSSASGDIRTHIMWMFIFSSCCITIRATAKLKRFAIWILCSICDSDSCMSESKQVKWREKLIE